jgi:ADP-ribose pyrophosphatase
VAPLFVYGTLRDRGRLATVIGRGPVDIGARPARLRGFAVERVAGADYPLLVPTAHACAEGELLLGLSETDFARLDAYETTLYRRTTLTVESSDGPVEAQLYMPTSDLRTSGEPWTLSAWRSRRRS